MTPRKPKVARLGPCDAVPPCKTGCTGWEPVVTADDPVWQPCLCGHSRQVHRLGGPLIPAPPAPPRICPCCGQPLPKENDVRTER